MDIRRAVLGAKGDPLKGQHIKDEVRYLQTYLVDLRFAVSFLRDDFSSSFGSLNRMLDRFAIPGDLMTKKSFKEMRSFFKHVFSAHYDPEFKKTLSKFSEIEIARLDEAVITLQCDAYFSSIIMCVSAVEARLHAMVKKDRPRVYERERLKDATLGTLLNRIATDPRFRFVKDKLPERYFHFFDFCNKYRIFSAHPKETSINYQDALSIFALSMAILTDQTI
jgi:hypothetical protein